MDKIIAPLSGSRPLSAEEARLICELTEPVQFSPGKPFQLSEYINGHGIAFLNKGIVLADSRKPHRHASNSLNILIDAGSFLSNKYIAHTTEDTLQPLTETELLILDNRSCEILSFLLPNWDKIMDGIQIMMLSDRLERVRNQIAGNARLRYLHLVEYYPAIIQQVSLRQIAAYLGITSQSLSRIRNSLACSR